MRFEIYSAAAGAAALALLAGCALKVETTVHTDCAWYRAPPKLSAANKAHFTAAPEPANAGAFFDVARDNKKKAAEFCAPPAAE